MKVIYILVDHSTSIGDKRLNKIKDVIVSFAQELANVKDQTIQIFLIFFPSLNVKGPYFNSALRNPVTMNRFKRMVESVELRSKTSLYKAIQIALEQLRGRRRDERYIVVIGDGQHNDPLIGGPLRDQIIQELQEMSDIKILGIIVDEEKGDSLKNLLERLDRMRWSYRLLTYAPDIVDEIKSFTGI